MTSMIVNLTTKLVIKSVDNILLDCPKNPYQKIFSIPHYRLLLVANVLSKVHNRYAVVQSDNSPDHFPERPLCSEEQLKIETMILENVVQIVEDNPDWKTAQKPHSDMSIPVWPDHLYPLATLASIEYYLPSPS